MTLEFEYVGFVPRKLVENMLRNRLDCKYVIMIPPIPQSSLKDSLCEWVRMSQLILCKYIIFFKNSTFYEGPLWKFHNGVRRRQLITPIISMIYLLEKKFIFACCDLQLPEGYDQLPMDFAMARISFSDMTKP